MSQLFSGKDILRNLMRLFTKKSCYHQGFFAVNGERFFMFLFLIPFTVRQQCIIYPHLFSTEPQCCTHFPLNKKKLLRRVWEAGWSLTSRSSLCGGIAVWVGYFL